MCFFFFKQKTAYEMRISDWSSDVCSSDLIEILIPTAEGGGADRDVRIFTSVWKNHIDTNFEYAFFPGAAGQVGYEVFGGKREPDCYTLLFANLGPEVIMQALQKPSVKLGEDFVYINQISSEVMSLFVAANSQFQSIQQLDRKST